MTSTRDSQLLSSCSLSDPAQGQDRESIDSLKRLIPQRQALQGRLDSIATVLVVLSPVVMAYDPQAMIRKIQYTYQKAAVFLMNASGEAFGPSMDGPLDLVIDFTGPQHRQSLFFPRFLRRRAKFCVGRNVGWFRKRFYDRVLFDTDAKLLAEAPQDWMQREIYFQQHILMLAGVALTGVGDPTPDLSLVD